MFSKLPELFERNFAIGFFLPVAAFLAASIFLLDAFGLLQTVSAINTASQIDVLVGTTALGLASWLVGVFLLATNHEILRFLEGYGRLNPLRLFQSQERRRYRKLCGKIANLDDEHRSRVSEGKEISPDLLARRGALMRECVTRFPDDERWVLPSSFGNVIRAFEVYPRVMYGLDSIPGWHRLLAVMPEEYRVLVDDAKAQVDFWVNLCFLSLVFVAEYLAVAAFTCRLALFWLPLVAVAVALTAISRAKSTAIRWGDLVKSGFDTSLPKLRKTLGFPQPATLEEERALWRAFSQAVIYVKPDIFPNREPLPTKPEPKD
jgi:hypothetical protein